MAKKTWIEEQAAAEIRNRLYGGSEVRHNLKAIGRWAAAIAALAGAAGLIYLARTLFPPSRDVSMFAVVVVLGGIYAVVTIVSLSRSVEELKREVAALREQVRSSALGGDRSWD